MPHSLSGRRVLRKKVRECSPDNGRNMSETPILERNGRRLDEEVVVDGGDEQLIRTGAVKVRISCNPKIRVIQTHKL